MLVNLVHSWVIFCDLAGCIWYCGHIVRYIRLRAHPHNADYRLLCRIYMKQTLRTVFFLIASSSSGFAFAGSMQQIHGQHQFLQTPAQIDSLNAKAYNLRISDANLSFTYAQQCLVTSRELRYPAGEGYALITMGDHYLVRSEFDKSLSYGLQAQDIFEKVQDTNGLMNTCYLLAFTYSSLKDSVKFNSYFNQSVSLAKKQNDQEMIARLYYLLGHHTAATTRNQQAALAHYLEGLRILGKENQVPIKVFLLGKAGGVYQRTGQIARADELLKQGLDIARKQNNKRGEALICILLAECRIIEGSYDSAEYYLVRSQQLSRECGSRKTLLDAYISFIDIKQQTGKPREAHEYQKKYALTRDSILNADQLQRISELEIKYETAKKEQTIALLEQQKTIQYIWRNVLIAGVAILGFIFFLVYRLQQTKNRKAQELLKIQNAVNDKLKELDRIKTQFFANVSHEFRTPLTLILTPVEGMLAKFSGTDRETLQLIKRNAQRLLELVNQLMDLSKLEAGKTELHLTQSDIQHFFTTLASSFESLAQYSQCRFEQHIVLSESSRWFDRDKIEKITVNLLSNAFKVIRPGGTIGIQVMDENDYLVISVSDTGPGISEEDQAHIFSPFYQVHAAPGKSLGTGLGLSLTKELVKLYGGQITLNSTSGKGSVFTVTLPLAKSLFRPEQLHESGVSDYIPTEKVSETSEHEIKPDNQSETLDSILIVEDNADLLNYMQSILVHDFKIFMAADGELALSLARQHIPNLIISDLMMPKLDGIELTRAVKADERTSHIPVILLTARNEEQARITGLKTGADDYLTKPFSQNELRARIDNLILQRKKLADIFQEKILVFPTPWSGTSLEDKFLIKARDAVEANLSDHTFSVDTLAEELHLSRTQLFRKLKALTSLSSSDFIRDIRLKRAAELIRQKADTFTRIGYMVGFSDQSYFTKSFKKQYGLTPSEYAKKTELS